MKRPSEKMVKARENRSDSYLRYKLGHMLPKPAIYGGYGFILAGIASLVAGNPVLGAGIILLGMLVSFTYRGVIIDIHREMITTFTSVLWLKRDRVTRNIADFSVITVNRTSLSYRLYSWANKTTKYTRHHYTLFLSSGTDTKSIPVATFRERSNALEEAGKLGKLFNLRFQATRM